MILDLSNSLDRQKAKLTLDSMLEKNQIIDLKVKRQKRSLKQNAYIHVLITLFAIEHGLTLSEAKTHLKRNCEGMIYYKNNEAFLKSTADLDSKELTDFIEWIRNYSAQNGLYLPTPEEYIENQVMIDREINQNRGFL